MPTSTTKIILITSLTGVVIGGTSAGVYLFNSSSTIKDKLISEGFDINVTSTDWETISKEHNKQDSTNLFSLIAGEVMDQEWLKKKCKETLSKKDQTNYKSTRQWCVKTEKISAILTRAKIKVLNSDASNENDKTHWEIKLNKLKTNVKVQSKITITLSKSKDEQIKEIKAKCKEITEVKNIANTFDENFELAKEWCSIKAS